MFQTVVLITGEIGAVKGILKEKYIRRGDYMQAIAYIGQFNNGQFISSGRSVNIPEGQRVVVTFLDDNAITSQGTVIEDRRVAAQNFIHAMQELRNMGLDDETNAAIDELQSGTYRPRFEERLS